MMLDNLYKLSKSIKADKTVYCDGMEIIYHLEKTLHEELQKNCYIKTKNSLTGYVPQNIFELYLLGIKFVFKIK